jgi:hypothetical protein
VVEDVTFDIAVSTTRERGGGMKIGVFAGVFGAEGKRTDTKADVSRMQFAVPVIWPVAK